MFDSNRKNNALIGYIYMFLWCIITAFSHVFIAKTEQNLSPITLCFYTFLLANICFIVLNIKNLTPLSLKVIPHFKDVLWINITSVLVWILFFYPLKYIEPAIAGSIVLAARTASTIPIGWLLYKQQTISRKDFLVAFAMIIVILYLSKNCVDGKTAVLEQFTFKQIIVAIISCIFSGIFLALNTTYAKRLSNFGFTPLDTLSVRFLLLILTSAIFLSNTHDQLALPKSYFYAVVISSISLIIIPQILLQHAISKLEPFSISVISPFMPVLSFFLEFIDSRLDPNTNTLLGICIIFIICLYSSIIRFSLEKGKVSRNLAKLTVPNHCLQWTKVISELIKRREL